LGFGLGYWGSPYYGYWDDPYSYDNPYTYYPNYSTGYAAPTEYNPSPNVTVIYPANTPPAYSAPVRPVMRTYDQYGQQVQPQQPQVQPEAQSQASNGGASAGSPIYLIASKDQTIRAALAYWVDGSMLHFVTLQHEEKQEPLNSVDRGLTLQLNRERRVPIQLPQ
jgi:hypothetical protein